MGAARPAMARLSDVGFWKLCGSGVGEGFTPIPNTAVYAILTTWPSEKIARTRIAKENIFARYRDHSEENWTVFLSAISSRGKWSGCAPFEVQEEAVTGPVAALTRATIKPSVALKFWGQAPRISEVIGADPNVIFKIGIGEVPFLQQVTFSIWPDTATMAAFARGNGPHGQAIRAVRDGLWFKEELYARFQVLGDVGTWEGLSPLRIEDKAAA